MDEDLSLIRWKLIIAVTVGLIFAVFAAFLVLAILVCRQKLKTAKRKKEMLAERLNRRHWLMEHNLINHLFNHFQPVDSSIPLPRTCPSAFLHSTPEVESGNSQNDYSLASSFSYGPRNDQTFDRFQLSSTSEEIFPASKINFQNKADRNQSSRKGCYLGWTDGSQFDSIDSTTPNLHRNPEKTNREASGTLFECDSGCLNMELSDVNHNSSLAGSDWSRRSNPSSGIESINNQSIPPVSFCRSQNVGRVREHVFPVI